MTRWPPTKLATIASIAVVTIVFAVLVYQRRWISDDGLIVVRVARQIAEGYGPNFNFFERAEPNTSALWLWLVTIGGLVTRANVAYVAVTLGALCAVGGFVLAMDAARRLHGPRSDGTAFVPCSALVMLGVFPFWDYATSGLETGLALAWASASYWLLVTLPAESTRRRQLVTAFVLGLGIMVRPDLTLVVIPLLVALWLLARPSRRRIAALIACALALPVLYTIFRAGYYGTLVPLPALAKSASGAQWTRGAQFVGRFATQVHVWIPLAALGVLLALGLRRGVFGSRERILIATPVISGALLVVYIMRVGGDFMHGRMLLVPLWLLLLPAMVLPLRRRILPLVIAIAAWAVIAAVAVPRLDVSERNWYADWDERQSCVVFTRHDNPVDPELYRARDPAAIVWRQSREQNLPPLLIWDGNGSRALLDPTLDVEVAIVAGRLGTAGNSAPLDAIVVDLMGLANPVGARITVTHEGRAGHEKQLPPPWVLAEYADPNTLAKLPEHERAPVLAARHALECGELAELLASTREPMSAGRFWSNLAGSWRRTRLVIPSDPIEAERRFCR